ncbi:MAG: diaminopimelate decarboxylase [Chloroflexi bacterium]|nr:diaminopimelate decarboxylase [Chloroflexota bacterium]
MTLSSEIASLLPDSASVNGDGHLVFDGVDLVSLAAEFGTPLYVYDAATIRARARAYRDGLATAYPGRSLVCYAGKAYCAPWLLRVVHEAGLGLDVVSGGELYAAQQVGFPAERIYFHGNNKAEHELAAALEYRVGCVVVDNLEEVELLAQLAEQRGVRQAVLLRVAPSVEAHTHVHIQTGVLDTKFGLSIQTGAAARGVAAIRSQPALELVGLHAHIGSQIFEFEPYAETVARMFRFATSVDLELRELSPGGGFGLRYTPADAEMLPQDATRAVATAVCQAATAAGVEFPRLSIEPGRSIVGPAGVALYTVGSVKDIEGVRTYVAVDGGMADNIRPTAYGAAYTPLLANRADQDADASVAIAGRYCESGDVLVREARVPMPRRGDLVAVPASGAYQLAMASNYNLVPRPAVVVVAGGAARLVRRRETYTDLLHADV